MAASFQANAGRARAILPLVESSRALSILPISRARARRVMVAPPASGRRFLSQPWTGHSAVSFCYKASNNTSIQLPSKLESDNSEAIKVRSLNVDDKWKVKMLYDGDCPLCMREVNMLRECNKDYGTIKFVDISADDYSAEENAGIDFTAAMGRIHAILRDGTILHDIMAFKRLYEEVGLGWVYSFTTIKPIARIADMVYSIWARYRLPITGRPPLVQILEERRKRVDTICTSDQCQKR